MSTKPNEFIMRNSAFGWIAVGTGLVLLIPLVAMQFTNEVSWGWLDFVVMGSLLLGVGSLFVLASRRVLPKYRLVIAILLAAGFFYAWAELAVGVFTDLGS